MSETSAIVEALYNNFLLRDLFAKIVPGTAVLSSITFHSKWLVPYLEHATDIGWPIILLVAGAAWVMGFAIQELGELLRIIRHHPVTYTNSSERYRFRNHFRKCSTESESRQVERYAIIKEATGNGATAIFVVLIVLMFRVFLVGELDFFAEAIVPCLFLLVVAVALLQANRSHAKKHYGYMESVVNEQTKHR